ncbi:AraC family transcriptional regulator [Paenibacillus macquariensis]
MKNNDSITEIAARVGCENPNYFTRIYKKYIGMTPPKRGKWT